MVKTCRLVKVTVNNEPGKLAAVTAALRDAGININVVAGWVEGDAGIMQFCTSDPDAACATVTPLVDQCEFSESVCVEVDNQIGALSEIAAKIADAGVNIVSIHSSPGAANMATVVIQSEDNAKVAEILG